MKVVLKAFASLGFVLMLMTSSAEAQTLDKTRVRIPFDFVVGESKLKAGTYLIKRVSDNALVIRSEENGASMIVNTPHALGMREEKSGRSVVFKRYGDSHFLTQVWLRADSGRQLFFVDVK